MYTRLTAAWRTGPGNGFKWFLLLLGCAGPFLMSRGEAQERESLSGEKAAEALKESVQAEAQQYNVHYGPVGIQMGAAMRLGYTDNAFYSETNRKDDFVISPEVRLAAFMPVSEINSLKLSVGLGYEYYLENHELNPDAPLVSPNSELTFNLFVGDVRLQFYDTFSYQQTLFINTGPNGQDLLFNFNNVGIFSRWDNKAGFNADWDLDKVILSAGYDYERFVSSTASFEYLNRSSHWFTGSASFLIGDKAKVGVESEASLHDYDSETTLNDNWRVRVGPFADFKLPEKVSFRAGGGYDTAQYDAAGAASDYSTYYVYGQARQETRLFTHMLSSGRETGLGDNANNLQDTYVKYSIASPVVTNTQVTVTGSVHFSKEFAGAGSEDFTYYIAGLTVQYQLHKYWRAELGYEYMLKNSNLPDRDFYRNRVIIGLIFTF